MSFLFDMKKSVFMENTNVFKNFAFIRISRSKYVLEDPERSLFVAILSSNKMVLFSCA